MTVFEDHGLYLLHGTNIYGKSGTSLCLLQGLSADFYQICGF